MDAPLNKAHLEARRAERSEKLEKWDEAIASHNKAADLLLEAEKLSTDPRVLESLRLQRDAHLRQTPLLEHRKNLSQFIYKYQIGIPGAESTELSPPQNVHSNLRLTTTARTQYTHYAPGLNSSDEEEDGVYKTLAECDSLLHILNKRGRPCGNTSAMNVKHNVSAKKIPKDEKQIMEELKFQNDEMRVHVVSLLQEANSQDSQIFSLQRENEELKQRLLGSFTLTDETQTMRENLTTDCSHSTNNCKQQPKSDPPGDTVDATVKGFGDTTTPGPGRVKNTIYDPVQPDSSEEEEELDYFIDSNNEFPTLEFPPLEIPEYQYKKPM